MGEGSSGMVGYDGWSVGRGLDTSSLAWSCEIFFPDISRLRLVMTMGNLVSWNEYGRIPGGQDAAWE